MTLSLLTAVAAISLLSVAVLSVVSRYALPFASRLSGVSGCASRAQQIAGGIANVTGGLATAGLGACAVQGTQPLLYQVAGGLLMPIGIWRALRGIAILRNAYRNR